MAYLRFASVYRSFDTSDDFEREITALRAAAARQDTTDEPAASR